MIKNKKLILLLLGMLFCGANIYSQARQFRAPASAASIKKKLNIDFKKYRILGACNPGFAHDALKAEDKIGVMLPCNVIVQEQEDGKVEVSAVDPVASMMAIKMILLAV